MQGKSIEVRKNTELGTFIFRESQGQILNPLAVKVKLTERSGQLYRIGNHWYISGSGYYYLNSIAGISILTPSEVVVDGERKPNPYIERDPQTKTISAIAIRRIGVGYTPIGNLVAIDATLQYNLYTYFVQSVMAKIRRDRTLESSFAHVGVVTKEHSEEWKFLEVANSLGVWVNTSHPLMTEVIEEHISRQRFAERIAQTIVSRNILRTHPAIPISSLDVKNGEAEVWVYGWKNTLSMDNIEDVVKQAEKGLSKDVQIIQQKLELLPSEEKEVIEELQKEEEENA